MIISKYPKSEDRKAVADYLLKTYPITDICETAAHYLMLQQMGKISITREQFETWFKIIGEKIDGTAETRGRKPLSRENENNNLFNNE